MCRKVIRSYSEITLSHDSIRLLLRYNYQLKVSTLKTKVFLFKIECFGMCCRQLEFVRKNEISYSMRKHILIGRKIIYLNLINCFMKKTKKVFFSIFLDL